MGCRHLLGQGDQLFEADLNYQVEYSVEEPWCLPKSERSSEIIK